MGAEHPRKGATMFSGRKMKECRAAVRSAMSGHPWGGWTVSFWGPWRSPINVTVSNRGGMVRVDSIHTTERLSFSPEEGEWQIIRAVVMVAKAAAQEKNEAIKRVRLLEEMANELRWKYRI